VSRVAISYALLTMFFRDEEMSLGLVTMYGLCRQSRASRHLELPIFVNRLDRPVELLSQCLREEALDRYVELLGKDHRQARINVVLLAERLV
jgi:hypothetical protein